MEKGFCGDGEVTPETAKTLLTGPIPTLRTPFLKDESIDFESLERMIDFDIAAGARVLVLTAGDSHYEILSDEEIGEVTRAVVKHVGGRVPVVAADRRYSTRQAVAFARECRELGVSMLMVLPPDWGTSCSPDTLAEHYAAVANELPVMLVTNLFIPRGHAFAMEAVERALEASPGVVAIKDDMGGRTAQELCARFGERCAIWAGGRKQNHLLMAPFGACGYLSTFLTFKPEIAYRYWSAWEAGRMGEAVEIIRDVDMPFFDLITRSRGGFDAAIHGIYELYGLAQRWRPAPYVSLNDVEMEALREGLGEIGLL